jgi:cellulose synthase/poly-beta-1,6-N-acetylglucosamine synthase-like glycosyltransferase
LSKSFVSVIIPHYNDLVGLEKCLAALAKQTYPRDAHEIIVIDNMSSVGMPAVQEVVGDRGRLILGEERGAGPARNAGVLASRGEILAFIDSDCVATPSWIEEGVRALEATDVVGGQVDVLVADDRRMNAAEAFERVFAFDFESYINRKGFTGAGNMFCRRACFDAVGGFRKAVSEDMDWSFRATALGYRITYCAQAVVGHPARRSWSELRRKYERVHSELYTLAAERPHGRLGWLLRSLALPASAVAHTPKVIASPKLNCLRDRLTALGMLYRLRIWRGVHSLSLLRVRPAS